jgi:hypothetical protein
VALGQGGAAQRAASVSLGLVRVRRVDTACWARPPGIAAPAATSYRVRRSAPGGSEPWRSGPSRRLPSASSRPLSSLSVPSYAGAAGLGPRTTANRLLPPEGGMTPRPPCVPRFWPRPTWRCRRRSQAIDSSPVSGEGAMATSSNAASGPPSVSTRAVTSASRPSSNTTTPPGSRVRSRVQRRAHVLA